MKHTFILEIGFIKGLEHCPHDDAVCTAVKSTHTRFNFTASGRLHQQRISPRTCLQISDMLIELDHVEVPVPERRDEFPININIFGASG